jgi:hypothetical protein
LVFSSVLSFVDSHVRYRWKWKKRPMREENLVLLLQGVPANVAMYRESLRSREQF